MAVRLATEPLPIVVTGLVPVTLISKALPFLARWPGH